MTPADQACIYAENPTLCHQQYEHDHPTQHAPAPFYGRPGKSSGELQDVTDLVSQIARVDGAIAGGLPGFPGRTKWIPAHSLPAYRRQLQAQLKRLKKKYHLSGFDEGGALSGLNELAEDIPQIVGSVSDAIVKVAQTLKPQPKPKADPKPGFDWQTLAIGAAVVVGGVFLYKKLGKKKR